MTVGYITTATDTTVFSYSLVIRDMLLAKLVTAPFFAGFTIRKSRQLQVQPQHIPYLGCYIMSEDHEPEGDFNTGEIDFIFTLKLGFTVAVVNNDPEECEEKLDQAFWVIMNTLWRDPYLTNFIDTRAYPGGVGNPDNTRIEGVSKGMRRHRFGTAGLNNELPIGELQYEASVRYRAEFAPIITDDLLHIHVETVPLATDGTIPPADEVQRVISNYEWFAGSTGLLVAREAADDATFAGSGFASDWPSAANRPTWTSGTNTLSWTGPSGGGATGAPVAQSRVLTNRATQLNSSSDGQVIEGLNITAAVRIRHNNVILRQCRISAGEAFLVAVDSGNPSGVVVEDCILDCTNIGGTTGWLPESTAGGSIIRRCNITGCENGIAIGENNMSIFDCWIHDLFTDAVAHTDGIQGSGGFTALTIRGNAVYSTDTSCIIMQNEGAGYSGLVIDSNLLVINAGSACILCRGDKGPGTIGTISITNNKMQNILSGSYNDIQFVTGPVTYTGNTDYITNAPIGVGD